MNMADPVNISGSLRRTLMISLIGGSALLALLLFFAIRSYAVQIAQATQDRILGASVTSILDAAAIRNGALDIELPYAAFSILNTPEDDRVFYAIYQDGAFLSGYQDLPHTRGAAGETRFYASVYDGAVVRVASASRPLVGSDLRTDISVIVAQTQDNLSGVLLRISRNAALFGLGFFTLTALLSYWVTAATISPLARLAVTVQRRGPQDLSPVAKPVPQEMAPLVGSLNSLMARLEQSLNQSEDFIAEAAHRVRTPLATVRSYAESTLQRVDKAENRSALRSMVRAIDESSRAAGQLLDHAMITFRADHLETVRLNLSELALELVEGMRPIAEMRDVDLSLTTDGDVWVNGDGILLQNAMRNLLDNALKYAPSETAIQILVSDDPARFIVRDSGPGFPPDEIGTLANRFARGTNSEGIIGSGLGLTIVQDVALAHGGALTLQNNPEGGACAILSL